MPATASPTAADAKLSDFLCFSVYSANLAFGRAYKPLLDELGITYTQWIVIVALWEKDEQTVKALGETLFLESNTLTPILKKLEELGFVSRRRDAADERQVLVALTPAGRRLREEGGECSQLLNTGLDAEEFASLRTAMKKLRSNLLTLNRQD